MCVICHKSKESRLPTADEIVKMWEKNPHGAGVMWRREDGKIEFRKGFMELSKFQEWMDKSRPYLKDKECAFHFRITTHGGTCPGNTHPFVVGSKADPHILSGVAENVLMHNGIISEMESKRKDVSDSAELARYISCEHPENALLYLSPFLGTNKVLLMGKETTKIGDWKDKDGLSYSNPNHDFPSIGFSSGSWYDKYDGFYGEDYYDFLDEFVEENSNGMEKCIVRDNKFISITSGEEISPSEVDVECLNGTEYRIWEDAMTELAEDEYWNKVSSEEYEEEVKIA